MLYVKTIPQDDRLKTIFCTRFRIPHFYFMELSEEITKHEHFSRWQQPDAVGDKPSNIKLLLLGSLRYIGRSWTFDDISESNGISREVNRIFFLCFINYGSSVMYKKFVLDVSESINVANHEQLFAAAGMNGCIESGDATNISMLNCPSWVSISLSFRHCSQNGVSFWLMWQSGALKKVFSSLSLKRWSSLWLS